MKKNTLLSIVFASIISLALTSCFGAYYTSGGSYHTVDHFHHGVGYWGDTYYEDNVIIIEDDYDMGMPIDVDVPMDTFDYY